MRFVHVLDSTSPRQGGLRLGEPEGNLVSEVLPCIGKGVLFLGEPETVAKCFFFLLYCISCRMVVWKSS